MKVLHWQPFKKMVNISRQIDCLFNEMMGQREQECLDDISQIEIQDSEKSLILRVNLPNILAKDLDVQISQDAVCITAETFHQDKVTFHYEKFQRLFRLPALIDNEAVKADFKGSILTLNLPKLRIDKSKVVKINFGKKQHELPNIERPQVLDVPVQKA
ncbi:MAG: Hsp20/alpha crystallin family protein [Mastigocoleus sp.]